MGFPVHTNSYNRACAGHIPSPVINLSRLRNPLISFTNDQKCEKRFHSQESYIWFHYIHCKCQHLWVEDYTV